MASDNRLADTDDIVALQNETLKKSGNIEFLRSLQPQNTTTFGKKFTQRDEEPTMFELMKKGHENPSMQDYTKNNADITNKIRKTQSHYISEVHDNFRLPERYEKESLIFNYFDQQQNDLIKKKTYSKILEDEMERANKSSYEQLFGKTLLKKVQQQVQSWLVAGKFSRPKKDGSSSPSPNRSPNKYLN